jgi:hypothetical protein
MLATILKSQQATAATLAIIEAFAKLRIQAKTTKAFTAMLFVAQATRTIHHCSHARPAGGHNCTKK